MLTDQQRSILASPTFGHVAGVDADGRPHVTPVWVDVRDDGRPWFNTALGRVKDRMFPLGAAIAISAVDVDNPYSYVQVRGTVAERITETGDADIDALAKKYLGADTYPFRQPGEERVTIVIEPEAVTSMG